MQKKLVKAADASAKWIEAIVTMSVMVVIGVVMIQQLWDWEGRDPVQFAPASEMYIMPGRPGDIVTVFLPLMPLRNCTVDRELSHRRVAQGETERENVLKSEPPSLGQTRMWNLDYQFSMVVPDWVEPGEAVVSWDILWDCGVRKISVSTPQIVMEVKP